MNSLETSETYMIHYHHLVEQSMDGDYLNASYLTKEANIWNQNYKKYLQHYTRYRVDGIGKALIKSNNINKDTVFIVRKKGQIFLHKSLLWDFVTWLDFHVFAEIMSEINNIDPFFHEKVAKKAGLNLEWIEIPNSEK